MSVIRRLAFQGIPDKPGLRAIYWKLLLGFLPLDQSQWESETKKQRQVYQDWVQELILDPHQKYVRFYFVYSNVFVLTANNFHRPNTKKIIQIHRLLKMSHFLTM